jgi:broad specificity phosphatase PhoE
MAAIRLGRGLTSNNDYRYWSQWRDRAGVSPASSTRPICASYVPGLPLSILTCQPHCDPISVMPIHLTLICHGPTSATRAAAFPLDEPLERQAMTAPGIPVSVRRVDRCWSSPALCARQTASALSLTPVVDPNLRDCDYGRWVGRRLRDVETDEPDAVRIWLSDLNAAPHGGEPIAIVLHRIAVWLDQRVGERGHGVAVTHAAVIRGAILYAIGVPAQSFWNIDIGPFSVTQLSYDGSRWRWRAARAATLEFE